MWVRIPNLSVQYWFEPILNKALSMVRTLLFINNTTANQDIIGFARCCVEVLATKALPSMVKMCLPSDESVELWVVYEWLPLRCSNYLSFRYLALMCPTIKFWVAKHSVAEAEDSVVAVTTMLEPTPIACGPAGVTTIVVVEQLGYSLWVEHLDNVMEPLASTASLAPESGPPPDKHPSNDVSSISNVVI